MPSIVPGLSLTAKGEVKQAKITLSGTQLTNADIQKYLKKKFLTDVELSRSIP